MRILSVLCFSLFLMQSCSDEVQNYPVGSDFIDSEINISIVDTFTIKASTFKLDSLVTSGTNRILLGSVKDENFGHLTAQSYFQVQNSNFYISSNAVYDSIGLILNYDSYHYGDTTQLQTYKVHRLLEYFEPYEGDDFYNLSKLEYDKESIGEVSFMPRPNSETDSIYIPLNRELGEDLFNKIRDKEINTTDDFLQYFKGLTIISDTLINSQVLGFNFKSYSDLDANTNMQLFYTEDVGDSSEDNNHVIDFYISSESAQFNAIKTNLENAVIGDFLDEENTTSESPANQQIFSQAGTGISARIDMPSLINLNDLNKESTVLNAKLTFSPLNNSYDNSKPLKDSLAVYVVDSKNRIINQLTDIDSNASYAILNQNDDEFNQNTYYQIDMSGFVEQVLTADYNLNYAIMIQFVDYNKTVDSVVIDYLSDDKSVIKLSVSYLKY